MEIVSPDENSRISLKERQVPHFKRLVNIITHSHVWVDGSPMGAGKTWVTGALAIHFCMKLFVICPKNAVDVWERMANETGASVTIVSYGAFRGTKNSQPSCPLLKRVDSQIPYGNKTQIGRAHV